MFSLFSLGPQTNSWTNKLFLPVTFEDGGITVGPCTFPVLQTGITFLTKTHSSKLAFVIAGDTQGMQDITEYSFASNQALTRAAFTNMVPDFMVTGSEFRWKGLGGMVAAGYWGNEWEWRADISFMNC